MSDDLRLARLATPDRADDALAGLHYETHTASDGTRWTTLHRDSEPTDTGGLDVERLDAAIARFYGRSLPYSTAEGIAREYARSTPDSPETT